MLRLMKIAVIGAGGVGGYFGGRLAHSGIDTHFLVRGATLDALRANPLRVDSVNGDFTINVHATNDPKEIGPVDAVLVCVKAWQIPDAVKNIAPLLGDDTIVVPMENGIDAPDVLREHVGAKHAIGGLCAIVSFVVTPGHIKHAASEPVVMFGELDNARTERTQKLLDAFLHAGVKAEIPQDIHRSMWTKFLFIAPLSGIGALTRVSAGTWRAMPEVREIVSGMLRELIDIANARGIDLGDDAFEKTWQRYDALAPASTASLQRDVMDGKPSELDAQLGAVVRLGERLNIATPITRLVYHALLPQERIARESARQT